MTDVRWESGHDVLDRHSGRPHARSFSDHSDHRRGRVVLGAIAMAKSLADIPPGYMPTSLGHTVNPFALTPQDIDIKDIAHHLSRLCRWTGAMREFYSVAEHSIQVSLAVPAHDALWGLLHDAPEAYLWDVSRALLRDPILGPRYADLHTAAMTAIIHAFGLAPAMPHSVQVADEQAAAKECRFLWRPPRWGDREHVETMQPGYAAGEFLNRFRELTA
jgi:uncharacterized protein